MKIIANITRLDVVKFNLHLLPRTKGNWIFVCVLTLGYLIYFAISNEHETPRQWAIIAIGAVVGSVCALLVGFIISIIFLLYLSNQKNSVLGEQVYTINEQGFHAKSQYNESLNKWNGIQSVTKSQNYIYIKLNSLMFHLIPRRAFGIETECEEFWKKINGYWKQAN